MVIESLHGLLCIDSSSTIYIFNFKAVIKSFNASLNVELLRLPQKTCAGYMCKEELKIINDAHKAHVLCENASKGKGISFKLMGQLSINGSWVEL